MPADLLFEIGCEEIPAKMLADALAKLPAAIEARLGASRLTYVSVRAVGSPRRLAVFVKGLADRQPDLDEQVVGPPVSAAYAPDGTLTKAGQGFAAKNGVDASALSKQEVAGKKGMYVVAARHVAGNETRALLPALLRELAVGIEWPKSMKWGWSETKFIRPVQWLVALFGGEVIALEWAGITAGRKSRGHRFLSPGWHEIASADKYVETLRAAYVVVDPEARRTEVLAELKRLERDTQLRVRPDEALVAEVIHLGEYPVGVSGGFDPSFLEVPEEMIVTAMRTHQRYFAMEDASGKLANRFAAITATIVKDPAVVSKGNEKVLASRLSDAKFFFGQDRKHSFEDWNAKLDAVVFQAKLGDHAKTIGHKIRRITAIVSELATTVPCDRDVAIAGATYSKADLASKAVGEFPELQGVMGRHYAHHAKLGPEGRGKPDPLHFRDAVGAVIDQHWSPKGQGAELPKSPEAALVAVADRMDTLVGLFAVGLEPSGSTDQYGQRRAAIGIWQILLDRGWTQLFGNALRLAQLHLADHGVKLKDATKLEDFFRARLRGIFIDLNIPPQDADAALAQDYRDPIDARARAQACAKISKEAREVFKRVANILDDARAKKLEPGTTPDPKLFVADGNVEHALYTAIAQAQQREVEPRAKHDYTSVFDSLERLRPTVAAFFDKGGVMVMDPDPKLRDNRLALLNWFITPYMSIADFRLLGATA